LELVGSLMPDVLVLDIAMEGMEGMDGLEVTRRVSADFPEVAVIILSMHDDKYYVIEAIRAGAKGFIVKSCACDDLVEAIHAVAAHNNYLSPAISCALVQEIAEAPSAKEENPLSKREVEVLVGIAEGRCTKEIAFALNIGSKTVETYRQSLMKKLNLTNVAALTKHAIRIGLVPL
jgi:DNA-binding NarL/FixJ family response regulator